MAVAFDELAAAANRDQERSAFLKINKLAHRLTINVSNDKGEEIALVDESPYAVRITTLTQSRDHILLDPANVQYLLGE